MQANTIEDFRRLVDVRGEDDCWPYQGTILDTGYGQISIGGKRELAHRLAWADANGPIPAGVTVDHRCHDRSCGKVNKDCLHRRCCNPRHGRLLGRGENAARSNTEKITCPRGHVYDYVNPNRGWRQCTTCENDLRRERRREARTRGDARPRTVEV